MRRPPLDPTEHRLLGRGVGKAADEGVVVCAPGGEFGERRGEPRSELFGRVVVPTSEVAREQVAGGFFGANGHGEMCEPSRRHRCAGEPPPSTVFAGTTTIDDLPPAPR